MKVKTNELCLYGILGVLTFVLKLVMAPLPNIEPVSLLLIVYTIAFGKHVMYPLTIYVLLEIVMYGFGLWSVGYLYIWLVLVIITLSIYSIKRSTNALLWATVSGLYGLMVGMLYIPLYVISGGATFAISWWISGIPYDITHCIANFILCLTLFQPLTKMLFILKKQYKIND
jgi:energy-coupling factor transport system substrate-specific component